MKYLLSILFALAPFAGRCCINVYGTRLDGRSVKVSGRDESVPTPLYQKYDEDAAAWERMLHEAYQRAGKSHSVEDLSDYGVMLIMNKRYDEARAVFLDIEKSHPRLYATAANIGTLYELRGNNDSALYWIKRAIAIDPTSHDNSEWIHVKILQAKIAAGNNARYYTTHDILGIDFGKGAKPVYKGTRTADELHWQLKYQLEERLSFVPPPDPVVAQLLFDYANLWAITQDVRTAPGVLDRAEAYGYTDPILKLRRDYFDTVNVDRAKPRPTKDTDERLRHFGSFSAHFSPALRIPPLLLFMVASLLLIVPAAIILIRKRKD